MLRHRMVVNNYQMVARVEGVSSSTHHHHWVVKVEAGNWTRMAVVAETVEVEMAVAEMVVVETKWAGMGYRRKSTLYRLLGL